MIKRKVVQMKIIEKIKAIKGMSIKLNNENENKKKIKMRKKPGLDINDKDGRKRQD